MEQMSVQEIIIDFLSETKILIEQVDMLSAKTAIEL